MTQIVMHITPTPTTTPMMITSKAHTKAPS